MENRTPLRDEKDGKPTKRESRLGFRSIFARRRGITEVDDTRSIRNVATSGTKDPSTADSAPSYGLQWVGMQSETSFSSMRLDGPTTRPWTSTMRSPTFATPRSPLGPYQKKRGSLATWDPIPLFQAYPQAIRTATLPACVQAESLLRVHNRRETFTNINVNHPDLSDQKLVARKKHRRNSSTSNMDWTTKLYLLVTSGYLLQYSTEGTHDRLPEKVVQLCKDSAAFASDVIPGRHWVLQVSSTFEDSAPTSQDTRSLFGKLGIRDKEKRQASDILMVFESAEDMENWMTMLRREIESLGGKRSLTETGAPRESADDLDLNSKLCPQSLAVSDPYRFVPPGSSPDLRWDASATFDGPELDATLADLVPDRNFDDMSTTNSVISHDGHQLDGLRDSSNRFSFMSTARTVLTSDSSPSNSPLRNSFGSQISDTEDATPLADEKSMPEVRRRPNGAEINDRRRSYRTSNIFLDNNASQSLHRNHSSLSSIQQPPNFSLPHMGTRRRAVTSAEHAHIVHAATAATPNRPPRRPRHPPPSSLGFSRPLSIVADSPSPSSSMLGTDDSIALCQPQDSASMCTHWVAHHQKLEYYSPQASPVRDSMGSSLQVPVPPRMRKYASTNSLRPADSPLEDQRQSYMPVRGGIREPSPNGRASEAALVPQSTPSLDPHQTPHRSRSPIVRAVVAQRRESLQSLQSSKASPRQRSISAFTIGSVPCVTRSDHNEEAARKRAKSPKPQLRQRRNTVSATHSRTQSGSSDQSLLDNLASLPKIPNEYAHNSLPLPSVGPPPAPPPNKALPPLPPVHKRRSESNPPQMRVAMGSVSVFGGEI